MSGWEWHKAVPGEVQVGHEETFLYKVGQILEESSYRDGHCSVFKKHMINALSHML